MPFNMSTFKNIFLIKISRWISQQFIQQGLVDNRSDLLLGNWHKTDKSLSKAMVVTDVT